MITHSISITIIIAIMGATYHIVLSRINQPALNRAIIMAIYLTAILTMPGQAILHDIMPRSLTPVNTIIDIDNPEIIAADTGAAAISLSMVRWIKAIYIFGMAATTLRLLLSAAGMVLLYCSGSKKRIGGFTVVYHDRKAMVPFSWGRWIFIPSTTPADELGTILDHECAHLRNRHWVDLLLAECVTIIDWYNPMAWLLRKDLLDIHEYQADANVISSGADATAYQLFLIKKTVGNRFHALANSLNHSSLNKRITMMLSKKPGLGTHLRALTIVPAAALAIFCLSTQAVAAVSDSMSASASQTTGDKVTTNSSAATPQSDKIYDVVEQFPEFPGGMPALMNFISENIVYPADTADSKIQGRCVVQFVVNADGKVSDPKLIRSSGHPSLDAEAIRVVKLLPAFTPGKVDGKPVNVHFNLPVTFRLN